MAALQGAWRAAVLIVLALPAGATAQATISTDRPGLGFNPVAVPTGRLQVELGLPRLDYQGTTDDPALGVDAALRWGVLPGIEARLATTWYGRTPGVAGGDGPIGMAGLRTGAKVDLASASGINLAVIPEVVLPVGNEELAGDRAAWSLNGVAGIPVGSASLVLVGGAQWNPVEDDRYQATGLLVAVLGHGLTGNTSGYLELGALPSAGDDPAYAGAGLAWLPASGIQLDAFLDIGLTDAASDAAVGLGISFLLHREATPDDDALLDRPAGHAGLVRLPAGGVAQAGAVLK